jgi:hypothetical protein
MILKKIPIGTLCRINSAVVFWNQKVSYCESYYENSLWISQNKNENRYYAIILEHEITGLTRCLVMGANTSSDNTVWINNIGSNKLLPI